MKELELANDIPKYVSAIVMACLQKDPAQRPQSTRVIREWIQSGAGVSAPVTARETQVLKVAPATATTKEVPASGNRKKWAYGIAVIAVVIGFIAMFLNASDDSGNKDNPIIEAAIREKISKPTGELTTADFEKMTTLNLRNNQLIDVQGLEKLTQLRRLFLTDCRVSDVKGLEGLTKLEYLELYGNQLTELPKGLEKLTQLRTLNLRNNQLIDLQGLAKLTQLEYLHRSNNPDLTKAQSNELQ